MKFEITEQGEQFQIWHTDCSGRSSVMCPTNALPDSVKEFTCMGCGNVGHVTLEKIQPGTGVMEQQHKHEWVCISPGEYDFTYECKKCGQRHTESIDSPKSEPPKYGCIK